MTQSLQSRSRTFEASNLSTASRPDTYGENRNSWNQTMDDATSLNQQEQRGVTSLQTAANAAQNGSSRPLSPPPQNAFGQQGAAFGGADLKRGGPVEFNHAISYVNKIKVRIVLQF